MDTSIKMRRYAFLLVLLSASSSLDSFWSAEAGPSFSELSQEISRRGKFSLLESIPALSVWEKQRGALSKTLEVAVKRKQKPSPIHLPKIDVRSQLGNNGFYYGITPSTLTKACNKGETKKMNLNDSMFEALEELRMMRQEMEKMRKEMQTLRGKMLLDGDFEVEDTEEEKAKKAMLQRRRAKECEKLSAEIENWAKKIMKETEDDGWKLVDCSKMMRKSLNPTGRTTASIKWMKDSRGEKADLDDNSEYPCMRCTAIIDAPIEDVSTYLSQESASADYNDLVVKYKDVEDISPNAKICWSQTPQILFLKPRDFVTLCHHRWKRDGAEVIVNQSWEHEQFPATKEEKEGKACRAYALRGANMISRCKNDPEKTVITLVAHANPGGNVPGWAMKTAVNALAPIEPFKIFHKINEHVKENKLKLRERLQEAEMVSTLPGGRSPRPAGIAQLGYACFWPNGGGLVEGGQIPKTASPQNEDAENLNEGDDGNEDMM